MKIKGYIETMMTEYELVRSNKNTHMHTYTVSLYISANTLIDVARNRTFESHVVKSLIIIPTLERKKSYPNHYFEECNLGK